MTDSICQSITLTIPGEPTGKGRPKFVRATGRAYTPEKTMNAEERIYWAWVEAGQERLPDGPVRLTVTAWMERPRGHFKVNGDYSKAGLRSVYPTKKPDLDNLLKLVADALSRHAYYDDAQIVSALVVKAWAVGPPAVSIALEAIEPVEWPKAKAA